MMELEHHHLMPVFRHLLVNVSEIYYILLFYHSISLIHMHIQCKSLTHFTQEILLKMLEPTEPFSVTIMQKRTKPTQNTVYMY